MENGRELWLHQESFLALYNNMDATYNTDMKVTTSSFMFSEEVILSLKPTHNEAGEEMEEMLLWTQLVVEFGSGKLLINDTTLKFGLKELEYGWEEIFYCRKKSWILIKQQATHQFFYKNLALTTFGNLFIETWKVSLMCKLPACHF